MKRTEFEQLINDASLELGTLPVTIVTEKELENTAKTRLAGAPYKVMGRENGSPPVMAIKFRDRTVKVVRRFLYQAIGEVLWPNIPAWKNRWFGLVMAQIDDMPKDIKAPAGAKARPELLKLAIAQIKRAQKRS